MIGWLLRLADRARHRARARRRPLDEVTGRRGEDIAHRYLDRQGWLVVARNYRPSFGHGEIDLVAWERDRLVFVEVKSRHTAEYGDPDRNVGREKRDALVRAAREYARHAGVAWEQVRFDVINVVFADPPSVAHLRDAFRAKATL